MSVQMMPRFFSSSTAFWESSRISRAVAAFVAGSCRQREAMVGPVDARPSNRRFEALLAAARV